MCGAAGGQKLWKRRQNGQYGTLKGLTERFQRFRMFLLHCDINVLFVLFVFGSL